MYDHTLFLCLQITRCQLVIADGHLIFLRDLCGYVWVKTLIFSPPGAVRSVMKEQDKVGHSTVCEVIFSHISQLHLWSKIYFLSVNCVNAFWKQCHPIWFWTNKVWECINLPAIPLHRYGTSPPFFITPAISMCIQLELVTNSWNINTKVSHLVQYVFNSV